MTDIFVSTIVYGYSSDGLTCSHCTGYGRFMYDYILACELCVSQSRPPFTDPSVKS